MSNYKNFFQDFPNRCVRLLDLGSVATQADLDVTLLLAVAWQAIGVPLDRLKSSHPSGDAAQFNRAKKALSQILKKKCGTSPLFQDGCGGFDPDAWKFKVCDPEEVKSECVGPMGTIEDEECGMIVRVLRNALAHGNLRTDGNPIKRLVFVSRVSHENPNLGYNRLECASDTLRRFLKSWVNELKRLSLDPEEIVESPRFAAPKWHENEAA